SDFYRLGFPETVLVSAEHARNIGTLLDRVSSSLPITKSVSPAAVVEDPIRVAIVGRPNVGKSSLINKLLSQERFVAAGLPGNTRDPVASKLTIGVEQFILTDTAGVRRRKSLAQRVEQLAVLAALRAMDRSQVAVLVMDALEPGVSLDARIAGLA